MIVVGYHLRHTITALIAFLLFWIISFAIGIGGAETLNKFTAILNPMICIVFGSLPIWGIHAGDDSVIL
ncbi:cytosine permease [Bacillus haynesii]|uniref:Cytosine permease n=1 Tax=Bacillus haynesii TaxID=1925021 RepID=A0AA90F452_9BACI|nr:cytosine permease [Bacillus haynesii]MCY7753889.1 cytosine permease [Bacillus haynesii]MCY7793295.1 cytosine permease [Bacillus haynesii]MCY7849588.1 cytosine permease [Bacillus haynesii]MCY8067832.1 cytosine permease [Bacillus haynesii]MCY8341975.1 cytosine permease [Bacillus haynesii]